MRAVCGPTRLTGRSLQCTRTDSRCADARVHMVSTWQHIAAPSCRGALRLRRACGGAHESSCRSSSGRGPGEGGTWGVIREPLVAKMQTSVNRGLFGVGIIGQRTKCF
eukprot:7321638-Prymnesium_polylepis.1